MPSRATSIPVVNLEEPEKSKDSTEIPKTNDDKDEEPEKSKDSTEIPKTNDDKD